MIGYDPTGKEVITFTTALCAFACVCISAVALVSYEQSTHSTYNAASKLSNAISDTVTKLREKVSEINQNHSKTYYVYTLVKPETNQVEYVGRTTDISRRLNEHSHSVKTGGLVLGDWLGGLTYSEARIIEQELIITYNTLNLFRDPSLRGKNYIRGIGLNNPNIRAYEQAFFDFIYNEVTNEYYCWREIHG